jgi:hypothetical protein
MQAGAEFPTVVLAHINGSLYLVDGWHRIEASLLNDHLLIWAVISEMTLDEARWEAAKANTIHGLPLKTKELREVFRAFIDTRQHEHGSEKLMPYREIAKRIGKGFSTIRNWMRADYPMLFRKYQQMANGASEAGEFDREEKAMQRRLTKAVAGVHNARKSGGPSALRISENSSARYRKPLVTLRLTHTNRSTPRNSDEHAWLRLCRKVIPTPFRNVQIDLSRHRPHTTTGRRF